MININNELRDELSKAFEVARQIYNGVSAMEDDFEIKFALYLRSSEVQSALDALAKSDGTTEWTNAEARQLHDIIGTFIDYLHDRGMLFCAADMSAVASRMPVVKPSREPDWRAPTIDFGDFDVMLAAIDRSPPLDR